MTDLPINVTFGANGDGFRLDQGGETIRSVQAFRCNDGSFNFELWGETTIITPAGQRRDKQEFQQNAVIEFDSAGGFTWHVTRLVFEASHAVGQATQFNCHGLEDDVTRWRRI